MTLLRRSIGLASVSIFMIGMWLLGCVPQATAETLSFKMFNHVTKQEMMPIADVEGHLVGVQAREGVAVFENGEWAWTKGSFLFDAIKGAGPLDSYLTYTFLDGSTFTTRCKGSMVAGTFQGLPSAVKLTGEIVHGTGKFEGMKGTIAFSAKFLPPEKKGEPGLKALAEGTLVYTLPGK